MARERIPIISLWMPWAQWVILGWKTIETRTHRRFASLAGKRIGIHATAKWDEHAMYSPFLSDEQRRLTGDFTWGPSIIGTVEVLGFLGELCESHEDAALIECRTKRTGLSLVDPLAIHPIPARGRQGIWYHDELTADVPATQGEYLGAHRHPARTPPLAMKPIKKRKTR